MYPGRLDSEPPVHVEPTGTPRRESHKVADFAEGAVRATYADGTVAVHRREFLFKHGDYWIALDRVSLADCPDERRFGVDRASRPKPPSPAAW